MYQGWFSVIVPPTEIQATFENGFFWNNYKSIESDFLRFMEYAPYCKPNLKVYSPKLPGLLLQIGGFVDSAFKEMANYFDLRAWSKKELKKDKIVADIIDACCIFESIYNLSSNNGGELIAKLDFGDQDLRPFKKFSKTEVSSLGWWTAYNKVKHEYSLHYRKASISNVLEGLAAAFLLNTVHYPSLKLLWQLGYLVTGVDAGPGFQEIYYRESQFEEFIERATSDVEPLKIGVRVETPLFLYVHG